jgi:hypothetical protein
VLPGALLVLAATLVFVSNRAGLSGPLAAATAFGLPLLICYLLLLRPVRFALGIAALLFVAQFQTGVYGDVLLAERSFFGIHLVTIDPTGRFVQLVHGNTLHGMQRRQESSAAAEPEPLTYFHRAGPVGQVFALPNPSRSHPPVAVVGLGAGSLAAYAAPGQPIDFYEIDPVVVRIAQDRKYFSFLPRSRGRCRIVLGDARLKLAQAPDGHYGLIVLDGFSSDAVPLHLITREAFAMYRRKLAAGGVIACNASSRYLELRPVLANLAGDGNMACLSRADLSISAGDVREGKSPSIWVVMARSLDDLQPLAGDVRWQPPAVPPGAAVWTDDHANVLSALKWE